MKKNFRFAFVGAIALLGAVGISSCSSSSDEVIDNPNYDPETNTVKTEFTISLPDYVGASTRQTDAITQAQSTPVFRGLQDMVLIPYNGTVAATSTPLQGKVFNTLGTISPGDDAEWNLATPKAKVYKTLDVPGGSKVFMFYGQAKTSGTTATDYFRDGVLIAPTFTGTDAASTYNFSLQPICGDYSNATTYDVKGNAIISYIQGIRGTAVSTPTLGSLLASFKPTAASSASIHAAVQKLWNQVADPLNAFPSDDQALVKASIEGTGNAYATVSANVVTMTESTDLTGYPANLNLPDGAVTINWTGATPVINSPAGLNVGDLTKFVYPAALYYRANSTIGVSTTDNVSTTIRPSETWQTITGSTTYYTWDGTVDGNTRSIALHDQIQYAVGRFDLSVNAENATLYDANGSEVSVNTNGFPITAVIIGGQKNVGYDFTPISYTGSSPSYTIYDNIMNGTVVAKVTGTDGGTNRTLVLETASSDLTSGACKQVNVAVEMTNNTTTVFRGKDGDVPVGGKFYLVGILDIDTNKTSGSRTKIFEQDYITTASFKIKQGTAQADLTPGQKNNAGLGNAYNVLPDLTISNLEVAFSVDLTWTPGLEFTVDL